MRGKDIAVEKCLFCKSEIRLNHPKSFVSVQAHERRCKSATKIERAFFKSNGHWARFVVELKRFKKEKSN